MRVIPIKFNKSFSLNMAIPTDISGKLYDRETVGYFPSFGIKSLPIPISDSFIHILK